MSQEQISYALKKVTKTRLGDVWIGPREDRSLPEAEKEELYMQNYTDLQLDLAFDIQISPEFRRYWSGLEFIRQNDRIGQGFFLCLSVDLEVIKEYFHLSRSFPDQSDLLATYYREQIGYVHHRGRIIHSVMEELRSSSIANEKMMLNQKDCDQNITAELESGHCLIAQTMAFFPNLDTNKKFGHYLAVLAAEGDKFIIGGDFLPFSYGSYPFARVDRQRFLEYLFSSRDEATQNRAGLGDDTTGVSVITINVERISGVQIEERTSEMKRKYDQRFEYHYARFK